MLARPVARHQGHLRRIGLVQRAVINDQYTGLSFYQRLNFLPQHLAVRWYSFQQSRVGVMRWTLFLRRVRSRCFGAAKHSLGRNQKVDVIQFFAFGWIHALSLAPIPSTA